MVETVYEEEEVYIALNRRYTKQQKHESTRYEPTVQGKRYEDDARALLLNYGNTLESTSTKEENFNRY